MCQKYFDIVYRFLQFQETGEGPVGKYLKDHVILTCLSGNWIILEAAGEGFCNYWGRLP